MMCTVILSLRTDVHYLPLVNSSWIVTWHCLIIWTPANGSRILARSDRTPLPVMQWPINVGGGHGRITQLIKDPQTLLGKGSPAQALRGPQKREQLRLARLGDDWPR